MTKVKLCRDCKHSKRDPISKGFLRCMHHRVIALDKFALSSVDNDGSNATEERSKGYWISGAVCGMRGALWEPIVQQQTAEDDDIL